MVSTPTSRISASKSSASSMTWPRVSAGACSGDQHQLPLDGLAGPELADLDDVDQLVELLGDLLERRRLDVDHDRDAAEALVVGGGDRQASRC